MNEHPLGYKNTRRQSCRPVEIDAFAASDPEILTGLLRVAVLDRHARPFVMPAEAHDPRFSKLLGRFSARRLHFSQALENPMPRERWLACACA